jgi:hypothetical protein
MLSIWWLLAAFVTGGYAGAVLVAVMTMARMCDEDAVGKSHPAPRILRPLPIDANECGDGLR